MDEVHAGRPAAAELGTHHPRQQELALTLLVVDTSIAVRSSLTGSLQLPTEWQFVAPPLLWSAALSALHEGLWRREITVEDADAARLVLAELPITRDDPARLHDEAWRIAEDLGVAKTYDAEFLALARLRGCLLVTADARLRRGADRLGFVVDPVELSERCP